MSCVRMAILERSRALLLHVRADPLVTGALMTVGAINQEQQKAQIHRMNYSNTASSPAAPRRTVSSAVVTLLNITQLTSSQSQQ